jgi:hypothetical protein
MQLFEVMRKLDADTAELSDISGVGIFVGKRIDSDNGEHGCISIAQFSDAEGFFKVAMAIAADDNIYERIMRLAAVAYDIRNITHSDEDENND